jgi:uncharacterized protein (TIGR02300 family)
MPEVVKPELGRKYDCVSCGTKFYDLGRPEPVCPKCGFNMKEAQTEDLYATSSAARRRRRAEMALDADEPEEESPELAAELLDDDDAEELEEDADGPDLEE